MRYLVLLLLLFCIEGKAQSYTFTLNECRVEATTGELRESFLVDRIRYFDRGNQTFIFDHESVLSVFDANITNYGRDSLKALIDIWIDSCNVVPIPTPPAPTALFANTTSLDLDGSTEYVTIPNPADSSLSFTTGVSDLPFSISMWFNIEQAATNEAFIAKNAGGANIEYYCYKSTANIIYFYLTESSVSKYIYATIPASAWNANQWHHLTFTYDGGGVFTGLTGYIDGINVTGVAGVNNAYSKMVPTTAPVLLGMVDATTPTYYLDGKIDQPTIFNKELSIEEVKEVMAVRDYSYLSASLQSSIVSSWYMDAPDDLGVAGGVTDRFGSNDGTGVNTTTADNLVPCITFPYDYQLDSSALYTNLTPFQDDSASAEMGFAWDFDGTNERIELSNAAAFQFSTSFTISAWVYKTATTVGSDEIFSKYKTTGNLRSYSLSIQPSDVIQLAFGDPADGTFEGTSKSDVSIPLNQWTHIMVTYNAGAVVMYINGESVTTTDVTVPSSLYNTSTIALIGCGQTSSYAQFFDGKIDEVILSNQVFTATDALTLYNSHGLIDARDTDLSANIVGYWNGYNSTNEVNGVLDLSGNGNNGTPANMDAGDLQYDSPRAIFQSDSSASFSFDNSTEYVTVPDTDSLTMINLAGTADTSFSVSFWANPTDLTGIKIVLQKYNTSSDAEWRIYFNGANLNTNLASAGALTSRIQNSGNNELQSGWHHYTTTYDGLETLGNICHYRDGTLIGCTLAEVGTYTGMINTTTETQIGGKPTQLMDGNLSHVTVMKGIELDLCQVQELWNQGSPIDVREATFYQPNFIHWRLNAGDDPTTAGGVLDIIGNINGTSVNMDATNIDTELYPTN